MGPEALFSCVLDVLWLARDRHGNRYAVGLDSRINLAYRPIFINR